MHIIGWGRKCGIVRRRISSILGLCSLCNYSGCSFDGPICGTLADTKGYKKPIFIISLMIGAVSQLTGDINKGVGMLSLMFVIGILIFRCAVKED